MRWTAGSRPPRWRSCGPGRRCRTGSGAILVRSSAPPRWASGARSILRLVAPKLPPFDVPDGHDEVSWLRELTWRGAADRYGTREQAPDAYAQLDHELAIVEDPDFPGYFLVVADIVQFCRDRGITARGRLPRHRGPRRRTPLHRHPRPPHHRWHLPCGFCAGRRQHPDIQCGRDSLGGPVHGRASLSEEMQRV